MTGQRRQSSVKIVTKLKRFRQKAVRSVTKFSQKPLKWTHITLICGLFISFFIGYFDSFRSSSASEESGAYFTGSMLASLLPGDESARDRVTTLTYDRESQLFFTDPPCKPPCHPDDSACCGRVMFDSLHPPYRVQAAVLRKLTAYKPEAVFFDFSFRRFESDPEGLKAFIEAIRYARASGVRVYVGKIESAKLAKQTASQWLGGLPVKPAGTLSPLAEAIHGSDHADGDEHRGGEVATTWNSDHYMDYPPSADLSLMTPAFAMAYDYCLTTPSAATSGNLNCPQFTKIMDAHMSKLPGRELPELALQWRTFSAGRDLRLTPANRICDYLPEGALHTWLYAFSKQLFYRVGAIRHQTANQCLYLRHRPVHILFKASSAWNAYMPNGQSLEGRPLARTYEQLMRAEVTGRFVLIGSALGDDNFIAPNQGKLPAVLRHAMALENLFHDGSGYTHWPPNTPALLGGKISIDYFLILALSLLTSWLTVRIERILSKRHPGGMVAHWIRNVVLLSIVTSLTASLLVTLLVTQLLHWPPINAFNVMLASLGIFVVLEHKKAAAHLILISVAQGLQYAGLLILAMFAIVTPIVYFDILEIWADTGSVPLGVTAKACSPLFALIIYLLILWRYRASANSSPSNS